MTDRDWVDRVASGMHSLHKEFRGDELAYLALTSKVEQPVVDRLAYSLQRQYGNDERVGIAREFTESGKIQRVDLAVIEDNQPVLFLEAKAMGYYHMYMRNSGIKYPCKVRRDICKMKKYNPASSCHEIKRLALLLTTYSKQSPHEKAAPVVKYVDRLARYSGNDYSDVKDRIDKNFASNRFQLVDSGAGDIAGGRAFGMDVTVHFRLFGPY